MPILYLSSNLSQIPLRLLLWS